MTVNVGDAFDLLTLTRAGGGMRTNRNALLEWMGNNVPRMDYDPITLAPRGLLLEGGRTNLALTSQAFDDVYWSKTRSSVTANAAVAPDGTTTADKLIASTDASATHHVNQIKTITAGTKMSGSIHVKAAEYTFAHLRIQNPSSPFELVQIPVSLTDGATGSLIQSGGATDGAYWVEQLRGGWWRISVAGILGSATSVQFVALLAVDATATGATFTGDGTSGVYIWGAQLEVGAFPSSYIPTTTAAVARAGDVCSIPVTDFPFNPAEGTLFLEFNLPAFGSSFPLLWSISDGTNNNRINMLYYNGPTSPLLYGHIVSGGVNLGSIGHASMVGAAGAVQKILFTWKAGAQALIRNGAVINSGTLAIPAGLTKLNIGSAHNGANANGHYRKVLYLPRHVSNSEGQALTT